MKDSLTILKAAGAASVPPPWFFYLFLALAGGTALVGLLILTACMKRYDATYSAASFVGSFVVSASIMSSAHYNTFASLEGIVNYILYPLGLVVLMVGVYQLVSEGHNEAVHPENGGADGIMVQAAPHHAICDDDDDNEVRCAGGGVCCHRHHHQLQEYHLIPSFFSPLRGFLATCKWTMMPQQEKRTQSHPDFESFRRIPSYHAIGAGVGAGAGIGRTRNRHPAVMTQQ